LPASFQFTTSEVGLWMPLGLGEGSPRMQASERYLQAIARLRQGIALSQAQVETDALAKRIASETQRDEANPGADIVSLQDNLVGNLRLPFYVLLAASVLVLLIGCTNLTNLLLARSLAREREITIRLALGAGRWRLLRQLITETTVIGALAGTTGALIAIWAVQAVLPLFRRIGGSYAFVVSRLTDAEVDPFMLLFATALSIATAVLCAIGTLNTLLVCVFAAVALSLAAVGLYGVMSYLVTRRTQEIGVRLALGAPRRGVILLVVRQGLTLALLGTAIGLLGAISLTRWMSALLFQVAPADPATLVALSLVVIAVAFFACYLPARRAAEIDPLTALRVE
jgi:ABC-type antimicrobial peptide transport system permease subunit